MIGLHREFTRSATLVRRDEALRQVFGMVGVPLTRYSVGQVVPRSEIERARAEGRIHYDNRCFTAEELQILGHRFLAHGRGIDEEHDYQVDGSLQPIESYFPPVDEHGYFAGSWVLGTHIGDDDAWTGVLTSEFNGYSVSLLAVEEEAEIVVEDDQPGADGQKARERIVLIYFTDCVPITVSLVGKPATRLPFVVVRCVQEPHDKCKHACGGACLSKHGGCGAHAGTEDSAAGTSAPAAPHIVERSEERKMANTKSAWALILRALSPLAKEEGVELPQLAERSAPDFATAWAAQQSQQDLSEAWWAFRDVLSAIMTDAEIIDKPAAIQVSADQFISLLKSTLGKVVVTRAEGGEVSPADDLPPVEQSVGSLASYIGRRLHERVGKKISTERMKKLQDCLQDIQAGASKLEGLLTEVAEEAQGVERSSETRGEEESMDPKFQQVIDGLKADNAKLIERLEKLEKPAEGEVVEPVAEVPAEVKAEMDGLKAENQKLVERMEALEKRRPAPKGADTHQVETRNDKPNVMKNFFRSQLGYPETDA